jgi:uncharacterized protein (DUF983 family)
MPHVKYRTYSCPRCGEGLTLHLIGGEITECPRCGLEFAPGSTRDGVKTARSHFGCVATIVVFAVLAAILNAIGGDELSPVAVPLGFAFLIGLIVFFKLRDGIV